MAMRGILAALTLAVAALMSLPATAEEQPVLTVYTYRSFVGKYGPGNLIKQRFEAECGCRLEWVQTDDAVMLLARLKLEGASTKADIVLGLDNALINEAHASGLFMAHGMDIAKLQETGGPKVFTWTDDLFLPFDWSQFALIYDETRLKNPPASLRELVEDDNGPTILLQDPRTSSVGYGFMMWMEHVYGDKADDAWKKLRPRIVTITKGWSEAYGLFLKNEADMVVSYVTSPAYHIGVEKKNQYRAAPFAEGHPIQVEVAALVKSSQKPELARRFLAFMMTDAFQGAIPEGNWMYPFHFSGELPAAFRALPGPWPGFMLNNDEGEAVRRARLDRWLTIMGR